MLAVVFPSISCGMILIHEAKEVLLSIPTFEALNLTFMNLFTFLRPKSDEVTKLVVTKWREHHFCGSRIHEFGLA